MQKAWKMISPVRGDPLPVTFFILLDVKWHLKVVTENIEMFTSFYQYNDHLTGIARQKGTFFFWIILIDEIENNARK